MLPGLDDALMATAQRRLQGEEEIWLTTVRADGQPQTSPVGFLWDGDTFLVVSRPDAAKVRNLRGNPRVSLHLDIDRTGGADGDSGGNAGGSGGVDGDSGGADGGGVLTVEGAAVLEAGPLTGDDAVRYVAKYRATMDLVGVTPDEFLAEYSAVVRITPARTRAY